MKKLVAGIFSVVALLLGAAPQASAAMTVMAGFMVESADGWCTVAFADPYNPAIAYTAAHCYKPGTNPDIRIASAPIGRYNPNLYNPDLDIVGINLYRGVPSSSTTTMLGEKIIGGADVHIGDTVCKYGATTQETCGPVYGKDGHYYKVAMKALPGDSGSPIYRRSSLGGVFLVGILQAANKNDPNAIYFTPIRLIEDYLSTAYQTPWVA